MRASWVTWVWPILILLSTLAVALITYLFPEIGLVRPVVIMGFLFLIPGLTVVRFFHLNGPAIEWMLAIALSFTIDASIAVIILYVGEWSPKNIMSFLIGFCFAGAIAQLLIVRPASDIVEPLLSTFEEVATVNLAKPLPSDFEKVATVNLAKPLPSDFEKVATVDLAQSPPSDFEDVATVDLAQSPPSDFEDVATIILNKTKDTEDTKKQPAVLLPFQPLLQEDTQEKTAALDEPELSSKKASRG